MPLKDILDANARFVARTPPEKLPDQPRKHMAIVTCMDFRLTGFVDRALGIERADAFLIRNAGNTATALDNSALRSVLAACMNFDIREVLVIGHTRCAMKIDAMTALEKMRARGIPREALGGHDLREWLGLITDERENVRRVVSEMAASQLLPKGVAIHGFVIDIDSGVLTHITSSEPGAESRKTVEPAPPPAVAPPRDAGAAPRGPVPPPVRRDAADRRPPSAFKPREGERLGW